MQFLKPPRQLKKNRAETADAAIRLIALSSDNAHLFPKIVGIIAHKLAPFAKCTARHRTYHYQQHSDASDFIRFGDNNDSCNLVVLGGKSAFWFCHRVARPIFSPTGRESTEKGNLH